MHPCNKKTRGYTKGYTLIEVLAALFIFVIVVAIISGSFLQILKSVKFSSSSEERLSDIQVMLSTLQFDFSQVINKVEVKKINQIQGSFYTSGNKLHFVKTGDINPDYQMKRSCLEEVEYYLEGNKIIKNLKEDDKPTFKKEVLLDKVQSFKWIFIDQKFGQYPNWPPTQDWQYNTPAAIKLTIELEDIGTIEKIIEMAHHE